MPRVAVNPQQKKVWLKVHLQTTTSRHLLQMSRLRSDAPHEFVLLQTALCIIPNEMVCLSLVFSCSCLCWISLKEGE